MRTIFLFMLITFFIQPHLKAQSQNYMMQGVWYNLNGSLYNTSESSKICKEPALRYADLSLQSLGNNEIQLLYFNYELSAEQQVDYQSFAEYGNIQMTGTSISGVSLFMPSPKVIDDNCTVTINVPLNPITECTSVDYNTGGYFSGESNLYRTIKSVSISHNGSPITNELSPGEKTEIFYNDLFGKNLDFNVIYDSNEQRSYRFRIDAKNYDWAKCGTPPDLDPINPDDWPPVDDGDPDEPDPVVVVCCPPPPSPPVKPEYVECNYVPDEEWEVRAEIPFEDHPIFSLNGQADKNDFLKYSTNANPGVDEERNFFNTGLPLAPNTLHGIIDADIYINPERTTIEKPIILTDGIDFTGTRSGSDMLQAFGGSAMLQLFFDGGYDLIIADFRGGADFIEKNGLAFVQLVKRLKDEGVEEIPAVIGPSMGGQIIRYGLLYWEKYLWDVYGDYNIETFLSADSPWTGANASPAIQCTARMGNNFLEELNKIDLMANTPAARQLLIHQAEGLNIPTNSYAGIEHPYKTNFDNSLRNMGDYPKNTSIISIADGGNGGDANYQKGDFPSGNSSIINFKVHRDVFLFSDVNGEYRLKGIDDNNYLVVYDGNHYKGVSELSGIENIFTTSSIIQNLDSAPGSLFRLSELIQGLQNDNLEVNSSFTFVPTFSALGIQTTDANIDVTDPEEESPYFDDYFVDNKDSGHNDFEQEGSIDFFLGHIGYTGGQSRDVCEYLEDAIVQGEDIIEPLTPIEIDIDYEYDERTYQFYSSQYVSNYCKKDTRLVGPNGIVQAVPTLNIIEDPCGLNPVWDSANNEILVPDQPQGDDYECTVTAELCYEHPMCPAVDIPCHEVIIDYRVGRDTSSPIRDADLSEKSMIQTDTHATQDQKNLFKIYPNPNFGDISIYLNSGENIISIYSIDGILIEEFNSSKEVFETRLNSGTYIIKVFNLDRKVTEVEKVITF